MNRKNWISAVTGFCGASFLWSSTALSDSSAVSMIAFIVSVTWISLFVYANEVHGR